ncbi:ATP-binding cassette domain-containing protein [Streptococcus ovis]|uniref:ATP-binding cassette domain-containing protein n=1 Tax=Streptococcus ovis TaxID=82806 RepID=UPI000380BA10|nr:ATP-binding cassette domain-containing protein [Streptococcus ovis]
MIEFKDFSFTYKGEINPTLKHINLKIQTGECVVFTGLSGCGKTTLLRIINGLCPSVFQGTATGSFKTDFYGYENSFVGLNSKYVGSILQNPKNGFLFSNADDECKYSSKCIGKSKAEIDDKFTLLKDRYSELLLHENILNLSSGESQTLSVLSSYIKAPKIIVMDEPTANLDINEIDELKSHINELKKNNVTIIIAEHRVGYLKDVCDKVYVMQDGTLINGNGFEVRSENIAFSNNQAHFGKKTNDTLEILNLNYSIKDKDILNNISLSIKSNKVTAIIGRNGSGKSTLGKLIAGLIDNKKAVFAFDNNIFSRKERISNSYFCMQDSYHQMVTASVKDEIFLQNKKLSDLEIHNLLRMLDMVGLENRHPSKLSGGQVLRLAVLLAYISNNKIVILDEPTSGLDFNRMNCICELIKKMKEEGKIVVLISHDLELLSKVADEYILLEGGKVTAHRRLINQNDFSEMIDKLKSVRSVKNKNSIEKTEYSKVNPIINLIVFFTVANAIFFYPSNQSSIYLMGIVVIVFLFNKNYMLSIKMAGIYFVISKLKTFCPLYYQAFIEIFIVRGMLCAYTLRNLTASTKLLTIIEALEKIKLTDYILIPIISFIRLFPSMKNDLSIAYMSLKTRKLIKNKNPVAIWRFIIVPVVFSLIRSAENLSLGIETKGMVIGKERTLLTEVNFKITDYMLSAVYILIYTFLITGGIKWIIN